MELAAKYATMLRVSPQKARLVADLIRGSTVWSKAVKRTQVQPVKKAAGLMCKLVRVSDGEC